MTAVYGGFSELANDDSGHESFGAIVAEFELDPRLHGQAPDVDAAQGQITFSQNGKTTERVVYGCWLDDTSNHVSFGVGDTRSLVIVVRVQGDPSAIDCVGEHADGGNKIMARPLGFENYDVQITILLKDGNYQHLATNRFAGSLQLLDSNGQPSLQIDLHPQPAT